jgi:NAD(P)H-dependent FMN reductase
MGRRFERDAINRTGMVNPILFDTSVWIDAINGKTSPQALALQKLIQSADEQVFVTPTDHPGSAAGYPVRYLV